MPKLLLLVLHDLTIKGAVSKIVAMLLEGHKVFSVASALEISPDTVRAHIRRLYPKLGVSDRLELMACCVRELRRLYPPDSDSLRA